MWNCGAATLVVGLTKRWVSLVQSLGFRSHILILFLD